MLQERWLPNPQRSFSVCRMSGPETVTLFLEPSLRQSAVAGRHNFIGKVVEVLENASVRVEFANLPSHGAPSGGGKSLSHMKAPPDAQGLLFRRVYHYPFWQIEQSAERWEWDVTKAQFPVHAVNEKEAKRFYRFWRQRLFGDLPSQATREGFIYVPLQGRLTQHRSFQYCSPIEMLEHTVRLNEGRPIAAALHPKEEYSAVEITALEKIAQKYPNITIHLGDMERLLRGCDAVITQNSSAAYNGYFFGKPAILFGKIDFHHIALNVHGIGVEGAFAKLATHQPDYAAYIHWFWQQQSINAGRPDVLDRIAERFKRFRWKA